MRAEARNATIDGGILESKNNPPAHGETFCLTSSGKPEPRWEFYFFHLGRWTKGRHILTAWVSGYGESWTMFDVGGADSFTLSLVSGWNFVSLPVRVDDNRVSSLFPSAQPSAYRYNGGGYDITESMESGKGYWIKLNAAATVSIPISRSSIRSIPDSILTNIFTFDPRMPYSDDPYIWPGQAYFVKVKSSGKLILRAE